MENYGIVSFFCLFVFQAKMKTDSNKEEKLEEMSVLQLRVYVGKYRTELSFSDP